MKKLLVGTLCALIGNTYAVTVTVTQTGCNSGFEAVCTELTSEINKTVNEDLPEVSIGSYGTGIANSTAFAYKGLTSDYSDNYDLFMVRVGGGAAVQGDLNNMESADGVGIGASATIGVNLDVLPIDKIGFIDLSKMDLMVSFMGYEYEEKVEDADTSLEISNFAIMARYQIIDDISIVPGSLLTWGGVHLHTGFQRSSMKGSFKQTFDNETITVSGQTATLSNTYAKFDLDSTVTTIPVEVSTYLRAGYVFTFFAGSGFDLVTGSTDVSLTSSGTASGSGSVDQYSANIVASESDSGDADPTNFRAFGGFQFNLPLFRFTVQANKGLGNDLFGASVGAKFLW